MRSKNKLGHRGLGATSQRTTDAFPRIPDPIFHVMLEHIAHGIAMFDERNQLLLFNRRYKNLLGYSRDFPHVGSSYEEIRRFDEKRGEAPSLHRDGPSAFSNRRHRTRAPMRWEHQRPNGTLIAVRRIRLARGGFIDTYTDITKLKRAERVAQKTSTFLQTTLEHMPDGIRVFDPDLKLVAWNRRALDMLGYPKKLGRVGTPYEEFLRFKAKVDSTEDDPIEGLAGKLRRATLGISRNDSIRTANGRTIQKRRNQLPTGGFVTVYTDITERCEAEKKIREQAEELSRALESLVKEKDRAEEANRFKSEFLSGMSHELRTPLNAIIGFSDCILQGLHGPLGNQRYQEYVGDIRDSGLHLLGIINDILDLSKIEAGKFELDEHAFDIGALLQSCCRLMGERSAAAGVALTATIAPNLPPYHADERRLKQVIINLLSNAVKFTLEGGCVHVDATFDRDKGLCLSVADTGIGMTQSDIQRALTPFTQINSAQTRKHEGTGLGLPLSVAFVKLLGGTLTMASTAGRGTTVCVTLPAARAGTNPLLDQLNG